MLACCRSQTYVVYGWNHRLDSQSTYTLNV